MATMIATFDLRGLASAPGHPGNLLHEELVREFFPDAKRCPICTKLLPLDGEFGFGECRARKDGHNLYCKFCIRKKVTDSRRALKEYRAYRKRRDKITTMSETTGLFVPRPRGPMDYVLIAIRRGCSTQDEIKDETNLNLDDIGAVLTHLILWTREVMVAEIDGKTFLFLRPENDPRLPIIRASDVAAPVRLRWRDVSMEELDTSADRVRKAVSTGARKLSEIEVATKLSSRDARSAIAYLLYTSPPELEMRKGEDWRRNGYYTTRALRRPKDDQAAQLELPLDEQILDLEVLAAASRKRMVKAGAARSAPCTRHPSLAAVIVGCGMLQPIPTIMDQPDVREVYDEMLRDEESCPKHPHHELAYERLAS